MIGVVVRITIAIFVVGWNQRGLFRRQKILRCIVVLQSVIGFFIRWKPIGIKPAITPRQCNNCSPRTQCLEAAGVLNAYPQAHENRVSAHTWAIMKITRQTDYQNVRWLIQVVQNDVGTFVGQWPSCFFDGFRSACFYVQNFSFLTQYGINRKKCLFCALDNRFANWFELAAHMRLSTAAQPVLAMHCFWCMMTGNRGLTGKPSNHHFISTGIPTIRISCTVAD